MTPIAQGRLAECIEVARRMEVLPSDLRSGIVVGGDPRRQFVVRLPIDEMESLCTETFKTNDKTSCPIPHFFGIILFVFQSNIKPWYQKFMREQ